MEYLALLRGINVGGKIKYPCQNSSRSVRTVVWSG
jgi:uncharacterized protein (DUF1697 family)